MSETPQDMPPGSRGSRAVLPVVLFALLGLVAVVVAVVYGIGGTSGKKTAAESAAADPVSCQDEIEVAARLAPLARGEVAAFTVAKTPKPALDISFQGPDGQKRRLSDFRGRTVLLNLWATWCVPCREEMPALDKLEAKLGGPGFEVVTVNIDTARLERRQKFLDEIGVTNLKFYADPSADVFQALKRNGRVVGLPTTILVGPKGCDLGVLAGGADWASEDAIRLVSAVTAPKS